MKSQKTTTHTVRTTNTILEQIEKLINKIQKNNNLLIQHLREYIIVLNSRELKIQEQEKNIKKVNEIIELINNFSDKDLEKMSNKKINKIYNELINKIEKLKLEEQRD